MVELLSQAKAYFEKGDLPESLQILNLITTDNPADVDAFLLRGSIYFRMQKWGEAINDFGAVLELDPDNADAKTRLEMAKDILGYFTPDMFNP